MSASGSVRDRQLSPGIAGENVRKRAQAVAAALRSYVEDGIADSTLKPGEKIPTEPELMEMFGGGRNIIRKTLIALEREGKITRQVGSGTYISDRASQPLAESGVLDASFLSEVVKSAGPVEVMEIRNVFEPAAAELAANRASANDVEKMRSAYQLSLKAKPLKEFEDLDDAFHRAIACACRNTLFERVYEIISAVRNETEWGVMKKRNLTDEQRDLHSDEHREILEAIERRDADLARSAMSKHLQHVSRNLFGSGPI